MCVCGVHFNQKCNNEGVSPTHATSGAAQNKQAYGYLLCAGRTRTCTPDPHRSVTGGQPFGPTSQLSGGSVHTRASAARTSESEALEGEGCTESASSMGAPATTLLQNQCLCTITLQRGRRWGGGAESAMGAALCQDVKGRFEHVTRCSTYATQFCIW
jgi:hypothetical protein